MQAGAFSIICISEIIRTTWCSFGEAVKRSALWEHFWSLFFSDMTDCHCRALWSIVPVAGASCPVGEKCSSDGDVAHFDQLHEDDFSASFREASFEWSPAVARGVEKIIDQSQNSISQQVLGRRMDLLKNVQRPN